MLAGFVAHLRAYGLKVSVTEWLGLLRAKDAKSAIPPLHGALLKNEQDVHLFERLAFMARRQSQ